MSSMLRALIQHLLSEWRTIRHAPIAFVVSVAVAAILIFFGMRAHFVREIGRLQATLRLESGQIAPAATAAKISPRRLTARQREFLARALSRTASPAVVYVISAPDDAEAVSYANDLAGAIARAGWHTRNGVPQLEPAVPAGFWRKLPGLVLFVNDWAKSPGAAALARAMKVAGVTVRSGGDPRLPANTCELLVGARAGSAG